MDQHSYIKETEVISRTMVAVYSMTTTLVPTVPNTMHTPLVTLEQSSVCWTQGWGMSQKAIYGCHLHITSKNHF